MSDPSRKVVRRGCLWSVLGGVLGAILGGILGAILGRGALIPELAVIIFGGIGAFPGAVIGAIIGARNAIPRNAVSTESSEEELARLRKRVKELEDKNQH